MWVTKYCFNNYDNQQYNSHAFGILLHQITDAPLKSAKCLARSTESSEPNAKVTQTNVTYNFVPNFINFL